MDHRWPIVTVAAVCLAALFSAGKAHASSVPLTLPAGTCSGTLFTDQPSKDGRWTFCQEKDGFSVIHADGHAWRYSYSVYDAVDAAGSKRVTPFHWTNDSKFLYVTYEADSGAAAPLGTILTVWRVGLAGGHIDYVLNRSDGKGPFAFDMSPTDRRIVFADQNAWQISVTVVDNVKRLRTMVFFDRSYRGAGDFQWTPNGVYLLIQAIGHAKTAAKPDFYTEMIVDLRTMVSRIIVEKNASPFEVDSVSDEEVRLKDGQGNAWTYDIAEGETKKQ